MRCTVPYRCTCAVGNGKRGTFVITALYDGGMSEDKPCKLVNDVGLHYTVLGRYSQARDCFSRALADCGGQAGEPGEAGDGRAGARAVLLQNLGAVHNAQLQHAASLPYHTEAAQLFGALGQSRGQGESLGNLAYAYSQLKEYQRAARCYQEALQAFTDAGDHRGQLQMCEGLGATLFCLGDTQRAIELYKQTLSEKPKDAGAIPRGRILKKLMKMMENEGMTPTNTTQP